LHDRARLVLDTLMKYEYICIVYFVPFCATSSHHVCVVVFDNWLLVFSADIDVSTKCTVLVSLYILNVKLFPTNTP